MEDGVPATEIPQPRVGAGAGQRGFAYLAVLLSIAVFGAISASVVATGSVMAQRNAEKDLLFVGAQIRNAIRSYYESGVGGRRYPTSLEELLRDPRFPGIRRHLRRIYRDPLTGNTDWGLVLAPEGVGIIGVYSKAAGKPLKIDGFAAEFDAFKNATSYAQWVFNYVPQGTAAVPSALAGSGTPAADGNSPNPLPESQVLLGAPAPKVVTPGR